jgi:hypothetical protein
MATQNVCARAPASPARRARKTSTSVPSNIRASKMRHAEIYPARTNVRVRAAGQAVIVACHMWRVGRVRAKMVARVRQRVYWTITPAMNMDRIGAPVRWASRAYIVKRTLTIARGHNVQMVANALMD